MAANYCSLIVWLKVCVLCATLLATEQQSVAANYALWCFGSVAVLCVMSGVEQGCCLYSGSLILWIGGCVLCATWLATERQSVAASDGLWCFDSVAVCFVVMSAVEQGRCLCSGSLVLWNGGCVLCGMKLASCCCHQLWISCIYVVCNVSPAFMLTTT